jgi:phosphate transport system protein
MADKAAAMVQGSLDAFVALDANAARAVCRMDDEVDRLNDQAIADLVKTMKSSPETVESALSMFSVVRDLERIADHATNVAEEVVYLTEGVLMRHHPEALAD